jgi:TetR/AcrR family transcriptional repressor of nem operon
MSMRYSAEQKEETRQRIIRAAARRFRRHGASVGIGQLMKSLRMTHGGFYRHFRSKSDLVEAALLEGFRDMRIQMMEAIGNAPPGREIDAIIDFYLSEKHCNDVGGGCPIASLAEEVAREPLPVRQAFERAMESASASVAQFMNGEDAEEKRRRATIFMSGMSGTLAVARAVSDAALRRRILETGREFYTETFAKP